VIFLTITMFSIQAIISLCYPDLKFERLGRGSTAPGQYRITIAQCVTAVIARARHNREARDHTIVPLFKGNPDVTIDIFRYWNILLIWHGHERLLTHLMR